MSETARGRQQQPLIMRGLRQQALDGFKPERHCRADQVRIIVGCVNR
ncbi:MAG: hypothetical protein ABSH41_32390 [Syntrophobacteraceae bacterium]